ncbi:NADH-quinone oxidoreductase subunit NuoH [Streptosporangium lutulentum]
MSSGPIEERYGTRAQVSESFGETTVDVAAADWIDLLEFVRSEGYEFFDWLTGVDEPPDEFGIVAHVFDRVSHRRLLLRTRVPRADPRLPSAVGVFRGANWHERETFEMFGVIFEGHPNLIPLLLPDGFEGFPCARTSCWPPGSPRPGRGPRNPASPTTVRRAAARRSLPACPPTGGVMAEVLDVAVRLVVIVAIFLVLPLVAGQMEHKVMAHMQARLGPMYAGGFHGWAQLIADGVKFMQKEEVIPTAADRRVFALAPGVALIPYLVVMVVIPIGPGLVGVDLDAGLFFVLAVLGIGVLGSIMAGWSSGNKYSVLGGIRSAAQLMSYELPLVLAASSVAMAAGTLSLPGIVEAWQWWWLPWQAIGAVVFFVAGLAELRRPPFDMPIADSEIIMGPMTEYTGIRFALFMLAEYAGIIVISALTSVLFLGGWHGPLLPGPVWMLIKVFLLVFVVIWLRVSYPRLREDQLQRLAWVGLVPLALIQLALTGVVRVLAG